MAETAIEWTDATWNPTTGCDKVSPGCDNCYALTMAKRLKAMGQAKYQTDGDPRTSGPGFGVAVHEDALPIPLRWRKPRRVFVNSMSDLFHQDIPDEFVARVFAVMALTPQHTYQVLTKRHARMRSLLSGAGWRRLCEDAQQRVNAEAHEAGAVPRYRFDRQRDQWWSDFAKPLPNVWLGVSVEDQRWADIRVPALLDTPAAVRWISAEPLLGPVDLVRYLWQAGRREPPFGLLTYDECALGWLVVGGESGPGARPMELNWARSLVAQCQDAGVAVFVKQLGEHWARDTSRAGRPVVAVDRHGGNPDYWPADLRVREYPEAVTHG